MNPKKMKRHRHHRVGYSSADEYESVFISEMTSDAGEDFSEFETFFPDNNSRGDGN